MSPTVVLVGGGKGGVGKSTVTAGLARQLVRRGAKVGVLDADISSPSQARILDCQLPPEGGGLATTSPDSVLLASIGLVAREESSLVWSDVTASAAIRMLAADVERFGLDLLLVDLPPGNGQVAAEVVHVYPEAVALLVTTGSVLAIEQCRRADTFLRRMEVGALGIVENMAVLHCPHCDESTPLFDPGGVADLARALDLPVLARLAVGPGAAVGEGLDDIARLLAGEYAQQGRNSDHAQ